MRRAPWGLLLLAAAAGGRAEERDVTVHVDPFSERVQLVDGARRWTVEGSPARALTPLDGRRVRVEGRFAPDAAELSRLVDPRRVETWAVPRDTPAGELRLELPDGAQVRASGPAARLLQRALHRRVRVRVWLFARAGEARVEAVRGVVRAPALLRRSVGLVGDLRCAWPVGRLRPEQPVWARELRAGDLLLVDREQGPSGEVELEHVELAEGPPQPRTAARAPRPTTLPLGSLRERLSEAIPGQ